MLSATVASVTSATTPAGPVGGGTIVTITGSNFTGATTVSFGANAAAWFVIYADTTIVAASPAGAVGTVHITVTTYSATSSTSGADQFTYTSPLRTFASPAPSAAEPPLLTLSELQPVVHAAIAEWQAAGADAHQLALLRQTQLFISALPPTYLGWAIPAADGPHPHPGQVVFDPGAQGFGWFIDPSPASNRAFPIDVGGGEFHATPASPAFQHIDLLTVVAHELGHVLGLVDLDVEDHPGRVMDDNLNPGVRRMPTAEFKLPESTPAMPAENGSALPQPLFEAKHFTTEVTHVDQARMAQLLSADMLFEALSRNAALVADRNGLPGSIAWPALIEHSMTRPAALPEKPWLTVPELKPARDEHELLFARAQMRPPADEWTADLVRFLGEPLPTIDAC